MHLSNLTTHLLSSIVLDELYHHESRWNPSARNGSHYGIPQGRSTYLARVDGFKQVDWGIKYNLIDMVQCVKH
jgi:hypothetical protein